MKRANSEDEAAANSDDEGNGAFPPAEANQDRSLKEAIKKEIHSTLMNLIFKQFENFVGSFIDLELSVISPIMAHVQLSEKFKKDSLA